MLFDMDGVLIDSEPVHASAISALAVELSGRTLGEEVLLGFKGVPDREVAAGMHRLFPESGRTAGELKIRAFELYVERFASVKLIAGAREFVTNCKEAGYRMAVATSAARSMQTMAFDAFDLGEFFETVVTAEDVKRGKPDPEPYLLAASRLGLDPTDCVVIEDSLNGVRSGKAAGCRVIGLTTSFPERELRLAGADVVIEGYEACFAGGGRL
ncbi:MAG TPA: HAD family phosphatase [Verrucomicrobium sp.]|nr:HAD family phosphatase [Verrucomicrobium sp.]